MNWKYSALFSFKSLRKELPRQTIEPILMHGGTYEDSQNRMKILLEQGYLRRAKNNSSFELTEKGDLYITPYYNSALELMDLARPQIEKAIDIKTNVEIKGGVTGIYFAYTRMSMFRILPYRGKGETVLIVNLPNLIGEEIEYRSNEFFVSRETLEQTSFLEEIIRVHMKMVDNHYSEAV